MPYRSSRCRAAAALMLLSATPVAAQRERDRERPRGADATEGSDLGSRLDTTIGFTSRGSVDLTMVSGRIVVQGWPKADVEIHATSDGGTLRLAASRSHLSLDVRQERPDAGETRYDVKVPIGSRILARGTSVTVAVHGVKGDVEVRSVSGDVDVSDVGDHFTFESVSGSVRGARIGGGVRGHSVSGNIDLAGIGGDADVETVSGAITLDDMRSRYVRTRGVSGDVTYRGRADADGRYDFRTHSGEVRVILSNETGVTFEVSTFSGTVHSDYPITLPPGSHEIGPHSKRFEFRVGDGRARVSAESFSGRITFERHRR